MKEEKSLVVPVPPMGMAPRSDFTETPSCCSRLSAIWASPLPYVVSSERTNAQFGLRTWAMWWAREGAWVLSLAWAGNQWVQPFVDSVGLVASAVTNGIPAPSKVGPPAADSPEKAGPTTATKDGSFATFV